MHFNSLESFAHHLMHKAAKQYEANNKSMLTQIGKATAAEARKKIGTLQPGIGQYAAWAPLANETVRRKTREGLGKGGNPESPLFATGRFSKSVRFKVENMRGCVHVGTDVEYIIHTELGTDKMPPRPVFSPAALVVVPKFLPALASSAAASLMGASGFYEFTSPQKVGAKGTLIE